ncbi:MAG: hypothetical protein DI527_12675 [Chelatococcus sp.]|nr:MAG: hypothetical protein DI527_12675 [Chelatococcus sp.]
MAEAPLIGLLPDGRRLHLRQGPIDLVIGADGDPDQVRRAYRAAALRFDGLLARLCEELQILRAPVGRGTPQPVGEVARRMHAAVAPLARDRFLTPMAAVAGSVADAILAAMVAAAPLRRAYVNNGGDIALHLAEGESFRIGVIDRPESARMVGFAGVRAEDGVGGVATSGYPGRSFSLGIAEAVTILAGSAAQADAAATVVANAVDLPGHPAVERLPANALQPDSDLGDRPVTRSVGPLGEAEIDLALSRGLAQAQGLRSAGLIVAASLHLQGVTRVLPVPETPISLGRSVRA